MVKAAVARIRSATDATSAARCRRKFLHYFPKGFHDRKYWAWERGYKWDAHERWQELLPKAEFAGLLDNGEYAEIGSRSLRSLSGTNLIFSFESMALRDALKTKAGAKIFATGLFDLLHSRGALSEKFDAWCDAVASLPKKQSRVLTHPIATVFGFLAQPEKHFFFKPTVTKRAASAYGFDLEYTSRPSWAVYSSALDFAAAVRSDLTDLEPADMIDIQSFIWVQGSDEYP